MPDEVSLKDIYASLARIEEKTNKIPSIEEKIDTLYAKHSDLVTTVAVLDNKQEVTEKELDKINNTKGKVFDVLIKIGVTLLLAYFGIKESCGFWR